MALSKETREAIFWVIKDCIKANKSKDDTYKLLRQLIPRVMTKRRFSSWYGLVLRRRCKGRVGEKGR